ncbi:MAG: hypothetical protein ACREBZ_06200 [Thermoplasmata archaeon]
MGANRPPTNPAATVRPEILLLLGALALVVVFLSLEPYLSFSLFGSDSGEYYALTSALVHTGHLPTGGSYLGWGTAYPDFPGIFLLAGASSEAMGLSTFDGLTIVIPVVAALSFLPIFLLFRRIFPHDGIALLGAAFASVFMPRVFSIAHPAPLALGDFLCVAAIWMFVESRRDVRWYLPLSLTGTALIFTHHLSTFFFLLSALGALLLLELWRPGLWSRRFPTRELVFIAGMSTATLAYWFYGTSSFVSTVIAPGLGTNTLAGFAPLEIAVVLAVVVAGVLISVRRRRFRPRSRWVGIPSDRSLMRDLVLLFVLIFGGISIVLFVPLPGTGQLTTPAAILWFSPVFVVGILCSGSRRTPTISRLGPLSLTWVGALGIGAALTLLATYLASSTAIVEAIPASRFVEYLLIPIGLLAAIGIGRMIARVGRQRGHRAFTAACIGALVLVAANAAIVYPPQAYFGGFQEGYTVADSGLWMWTGIGVPANATIASDHRLSSAVFGFDGNPATWDSTPALFTGSNWSAAQAELVSSGAPHTPHAIDYVIVDSVMYTGVALNPADAAQPLSAAAIAWFTQLPFVPVYENGPNVIYVVDSASL